MCMTLTEMSMQEAFFFPVMQAKTNVQSQLVKLFQVKTARYGHEEKSQKTCETAKQCTRKPPEVKGVENGNMFKMQSVVKRDKEKI